MHFFNHFKMVCTFVLLIDLIYMVVNIYKSCITIVYKSDEMLIEKIKLHLLVQI